MSYKQTGILLLLQVFLFIQCSTAETSNSKHKKNIKTEKRRNNFTDTTTAVNVNKPASGSTNNSALKTQVQENVKANFKQLKFGFNIGYLASLQNKDIYTKALTRIKSDGINILRVYEPFSKKNANNPELISDILKPVSDAGFKILLCFSNYPFDDSSPLINNASAGEHAQELKFTNRFAPSDLNKYGAVLNRVLNRFKEEGIIQNLSFEIGNEPTAKQYFWGTGANFIQIAKYTKAILAKYNQPVYCCGFNTQFAINSQEFDRDYMNLINDQGFFDNVNLSFHFYPNDKYQFSDIKIPRTNNAIITEFNIFSYQKQNTENKVQYSNSAAFGKWMAELLEYTYDNNIQTVYLFNLMDDEKKAGALGFFDTDGNPKQSYNYFIKLYNVIKDGYKVEKNNNTVKIIGQNQTIIYLRTSINKNGRPMQNAAQDQNDWKIVNN